MALKIIIATKAINKLDELIEYIDLEFGFEVASSFANKFYEIVDLLSEYPQIGSVEKKKEGIRGFLISKQTRLFYRVDKDRLIIIKLFDTRQSPKKRLK